MTGDRPSSKKRNLRTALVLLAVVLCFFAAVISAQVLGGPVGGVSVVGALVLVFLVVAISRSLRR